VLAILALRVPADNLKCPGWRSAMLHTRRCDVLAAEPPIIGAPMAGAATAERAIPVEIGRTVESGERAVG